MPDLNMPTGINPNLGINQQPLPAGPFPPQKLPQHQQNLADIINQTFPNQPHHVGQPPKGGVGAEPEAPKNPASQSTAGVPGDANFVNQMANIFGGLDGNNIIALLQAALTMRLDATIDQMKGYTDHLKQVTDQQKSVNNVTSAITASEGSNTNVDDIQCTVYDSSGNPVQLPYKDADGNEVNVYTWAKDNNIDLPDPGSDNIWGDDEMKEAVNNLNTAGTNLNYDSEQLNQDITTIQNVYSELVKMQTSVESGRHSMSTNDIQNWGR